MLHEMCSYLFVNGLHVLGALIYVGFKHWHWHWHLLVQPWTVIVLYCSEPSLQDVAHCVVGVWGLGKSWCWGLGQGLGPGLALGLGLDLGLGLGLGGCGGKRVWKRVWKHVCEFERGYLCHLTNCVREICVDFTAAILRARFYMYFPCV